MLNATILFETGTGFRYGKSKSLWKVRKEFHDARHLDNFIKMMIRKKGYQLDEVYYNSGYPFNKGDVYYTIEKFDGIYRVIRSVWNEMSEALYSDLNSYYHDRNTAEIICKRMV